MDEDARAAELMQKMLRKKLYVILSKGAATAEQIGAVLPQHLEYMIGLEKTGVLFASGRSGWRRADHPPRRERRGGPVDRVRRSVRHQQASQLRGPRVDLDGRLVRREGEFLRPVARHRVTGRNEQKWEQGWKP